MVGHTLTERSAERFLPDERGAVEDHDTVLVRDGGREPADGLVVACSLRNVAAVAHWLRGRAGTPEDPVSVIAAGERWPDGSLRPALEDLLGAGALLSALAQEGNHLLSPEAEAAVATYRGTGSVPYAVRGCASGLELVDRGFSDDVEMASELSVSAAVPVLTDGAFVAR